MPIPGPWDDVMDFIQWHMECYYYGRPYQGSCAIVLVNLQLDSGVRRNTGTRMIAWYSLR